MEDKKIKTVGSAFVEKMSAANLTQEQLFEHLFHITGKDCKLENLGLPSNAAVAFLESSKAKYRIKLYNQKAIAILPKLDKIKSVAQKKSILEMLNIMAPKEKDYAVIAMDTYLKMDKKNTIEGFLSEYGRYQNKQKTADYGNSKIDYMRYQQTAIEMF